VNELGIDLDHSATRELCHAPIRVHAGARGVPLRQRAPNSRPD
jgi:hypothetical protein